MQPEQGSNDRQAAMFITVFMALLSIGATGLITIMIYYFALAPSVDAARADLQVPYAYTDGIQQATQPSSERVDRMRRLIEEEGDVRPVWLGETAWTEGIQAGQEYIAEFPQPQNVQVLTGMNNQQIWAYMQNHVSGAMGVGCQYCHDLNNFASYTYPQKTSGLRMLQMMQQLNSQYIVNLPNWRGNYVQCATCHLGEAVNMPTVSEQFVNSTPQIDVYLEPLGPEGEPQRDPAMNVSLKEATLYYLYNYQVWRPYDGTEMSGRGSLAMAYEDGRTQDQVTIAQNTMNVMGWSMGEGCTYCHNARNFYAYEADVSSPQFHQDYGVARLKSQRMLQMTTFLADNWDQFVLPRPAVQEGQSETPATFPVDGRQYFANTNGANYALPGCYTCHRGYTIPQASVNITELDTLDPDAQIVAFPPTLTGLVDTVEQPTE